MLQYILFHAMKIMGGIVSQKYNYCMWLERYRAHKAVVMIVSWAYMYHSDQTVHAIVSGILMCMVVLSMA